MSTLTIGAKFSTLKAHLRSNTDHVTLANHMPAQAFERRALSRLEELADQMRSSPKMRKKKSSPVDVEERRKYFKYQELKQVFVGANLLLGWTNDFVQSSSLNNYFVNVERGFSLTAEPTKEMLAKFSTHGKTAIVKEGVFAKDEKVNDRKRLAKSSVLVKLETPKLAYSLQPVRNMAYGIERMKNLVAALQTYTLDLQKVDEQFAHLFPKQDFQFGRTLKLVKDSFGARKVVLNIGKKGGENVGYISPLYSFADFAQGGRAGSKSFTDNVVKATGMGTVLDDDNMPPKDYTEMMEFQFSMKPDALRVPLSTYQIDRILGDATLGKKFEEGTLTWEEYMQITGSDNIPAVQFELGCDIYIRYPLEYAMWATRTTSPSEFNIPMFVDLHNTRVTRSTYVGRGQSKTPTWWSGMNKVRDEVRTYEKEFQFKFKPRTNEDGFALTKSATVIWLPDVDNTDTYMEKMKSRYNRDTHEILTPHSVGLANYPIFTDWKNNKFAYGDDSGKLTIIDISGCCAMPAAFIWRSLGMKLISGDKSIAGRFLMQHIKHLDPDNKIAAECIAKAEELNGMRWPWSRSFTAAFDILLTRSGFNELSFVDLFGPFESDDGKAIPNWSRKDNPPLYLALDMIRLGLPKVREKLERGEHDMALKTVVEDARFGAYVLTKYADAKAKIAEQYNELRDANRVADVDSEGYVPQIANAPTLEYLQPHQTDIAAKLDAKDPKFAIIDVSAGGGKTITAIEDIMRLKAKKKIKRPIVITKDGLVSEFMTEIARVGGGKINGVPLTSQSIETHINNFGDFDAKAMVKWIKSFPENTIFVAGYNFVKKSDWSGDKALFRNLDANGGTVRMKSELVYGNYAGTPYQEKTPYGTMTAYRPLATFPIADILILCEFDYVAVDEAHYVKETSSQVTQAVNNVLATAPYRRWMSGTIVTNTALDLVGVTSTLGVLGDKDSFRAQYMTGLKLKNGDATAKEIFDRIEERMAIVTKRRKDWAYIMPDIEEQIIEAPMTETQQKFYSALFEEAMTEFEKEYKNILGKKGGKEETEGGSEEEPSEEDDVTNERIEEALKTTLTRLEVFMGAPDEDRPRGKHASTDGVKKIDAFENIIPKPSPDDLISPKVKVLNQVLAAHFNGVPFGTIKQDTSLDTDGNPSHKVVILGYNKEISRHVMKHLAPQFKNMAIRYVASPSAADAGLDLKPAKEALQQFRTDKRIKILVADQASMQEGYNLQMASRVIELQTVWSPGRQEQVRARVLRPDPRGKFNRDNVSVTVIAAVSPNQEIASVDYAKFARMVTKIISKARIDYAKDSSWQRKMAKSAILKEFDEKTNGGFKMSPKTIRNIRPEDLDIFFRTYTAFVEWEQGEFRESRLRLKKKLEARLGRGEGTPGGPISMSELKKLALIPIRHLDPLPGSKRVFCPFVYGQEIYDPLGLDLKSISAYDTDNMKFGDEENDDEDEKTLFEIKEGLPCWTAYGPGRVIGTPRTKIIRVEVPGLGEVRVTKGTCFIPTTDKGMARFQRLLNHLGSTGAPTVDNNGMPIAMRDLTKLDLDKGPLKPTRTENKPPLKPTRVVEEPEDEAEEEFEDIENESEEDEDTFGQDVSIHPLVINGARSLVFVGDSDDERSRLAFLKAFGTRGWRRVPDFIRIKIANFRVLQEWIDRLGDKYNIKEERVQYMIQIADQLRKGGNALVVDDLSISAIKSFKNFYNLSHGDPPKNIKGEMRTVRPWLVTFKSAVYIAFDVYSHHPQLLQELVRMYNGIKKKRGAAVEPAVVDYWAIRFINSVADAKTQITAIEAHPNFKVEEYENVMEDIEAFAQIKKVKKSEIEEPIIQKGIGKPKSDVPQSKLKKVTGKPPAKTGFGKRKSGSPSAKSKPAGFGNRKSSVKPSAKPSAKKPSGFGNRKR